MAHVHVALRMRPPKADNSEYVTIVPPGMIVLTKPGDGEMFHFQYNNAMLAVDNQTVYDSSAREVVDAVLDGYNGTLLAYGQTGAGKTFTMLGPGTKLKDMTEDEKGCMPRAMYQIFDALENSGKYSSWKMQLSYIEVYLEKIYDLLGTPGKAGLVEGDVIVSKDGVARLKNITPTSVGSLKDVEKLIERGQDVRQQGDNGINARSSRSHTILTVWLQTTTNQGNFATKLNLVDLAGSERRGKMGDQGKKTHAEGDAINKSLLTLQRVVMSLGTGGTPSFRESKLTRFLQDSLGGNCKTALIACAWGEPDKSSETLSTCKFAENMTKVVVNAKKNKGASVGNKLKIDPVMMAMMEERIRQRVEEEKRKLAGPSPEEIRELEEYRRKFAELDEAKKNLARSESSAGRSTAKAPSQNAQNEIERLKKQLEEKQMELEDVNADLRHLKQNATHSRPGVMDEDDDMPTVDESVETFAKLKRVQPRQQELQKQLDNEGKLDEDDAETLEYLNDEVQSLLEILQQHGFNIPGMANPNNDEQEVNRAMDEVYTESDDGYQDQSPRDFSSQHGTLSSQQGTPSSRSSRGGSGIPFPGLNTPAGGSSPLGTNQHGGCCHSLPVDSEPASPDQSHNSATGGVPRHVQRGLSAKWGSQTRPSRSSSVSSPVDRSTTMEHLTSVPNNLIKRQPSFLGKLGSSFTGRFGGQRPQAPDDLTSVNRLQQKGKAQRVPDMVFLSPLDYNGVASELQDRCDIGQSPESDELSLDKMPRMPQ